MPPLLDATIARYAALRRYADAGRVLEWRAGGWELERPFETTFVRDERFRLEVRLAEFDDAPLVIEAVGDEVTVARPFGRRFVGGLERALAEHAGVTAAASWVVPSLLLGLAHGRSRGAKS